jgi:hypothetical protein
MGTPPLLLVTGLSAALAAAALHHAAADRGRGVGCPVESPAPRESEVYRARSEAKDRVVAQVAAGELDLFGAAMHFRQLNHEPPELASHAYRALPGRTNEEKLCRQVILWLRAQKGGHLSPSEVEQAAAGLEDALASRFGAVAATAPCPEAVGVLSVE